MGENTAGRDRRIGAGSPIVIPALHGESTAEASFMRDTETSHFWLGHFPNEKQVEAYFAELYDDEDEDREHTPLSRFARDQGEKWYDHDFMEYGFKMNAKSVEDLVNGYSYFEQWSDELARRAAEVGLTKINMLVFISKDQIDSPRSVEGDGYRLSYLGTIKYRI